MEHELRRHSVVGLISTDWGPQRWGSYRLGGVPGPVAPHAWFGPWDLPLCAQRLRKLHLLGSPGESRAWLDARVVLVLFLPAGDNGSAWMPLTLKWIGQNPEEQGA